MPKNALIERRDQRGIVDSIYALVPDDAPNPDFCIPCGGDAKTNRKCTCNPRFLAKMKRIAEEYAKTQPTD